MDRKRGVERKKGLLLFLEDPFRKGEERVGELEREGGASGRVERGAWGAPQGGRSEGVERGRCRGGGWEVKEVLSFFYDGLEGTTTRQEEGSGVEGGGGEGSGEGGGGRERVCVIHGRVGGASEGVEEVQ